MDHYVSLWIEGTRKPNMLVNPQKLSMIQGYSSQLLQGGHFNASYEIRKVDIPVVSNEVGCGAGTETSNTSNILLQAAEMFVRQLDR